MWLNIMFLREAAVDYSHSLMRMAVWGMCGVLSHHNYLYICRPHGRRMLAHVCLRVLMVVHGNKDGFRNHTEEWLIIDINKVMR